MHVIIKSRSEEPLTGETPFHSPRRLSVRTTLKSTVTIPARPDLEGIPDSTPMPPRTTGPIAAPPRVTPALIHSSWPLGRSFQNTPLLHRASEPVTRPITHPVTLQGRPAQPRSPHPPTAGCKVCRRVFRRSRGWKSSVEQVPLMEPQTKAFSTGCIWRGTGDMTALSASKPRRKEREGRKIAPLRCGRAAGSRTSRPSAHGAPGSGRRGPPPPVCHAGGATRDPGELRVRRSGPDARHYLVLSPRHPSAPLNQ